jgi:OOP family OmpA-OmpF porin
MRVFCKAGLVAIIFVSSQLYAGKSIAPAETDVIPVSTDCSSWYLGVGLTSAKFRACRITGCNYEDITYGVMLRGGYNFNRYFGVEARALRTFLGKGPFGGVPLQHIGIYAKPQLPLGDRINMYGLLGYGYTENLGNGERLNYFKHDHGFSAGLGFEYDLSGAKKDIGGRGDYDQDMSLFVDYQRLLIKTNVPDMHIITVGLKFDF